MTDEREMEEIADKEWVKELLIRNKTVTGQVDAIYHFHAEALSKERELKKEAEQVLIPTQESLILAEGNLEKAETKFKHLDEKYDDLQKDYIELLKKWEASNGVD